MRFHEGLPSSAPRRFSTFRLAAAGVVPVTVAAAAVPQARHAARRAAEVRAEHARGGVLVHGRREELDR